MRAPTLLLVLAFVGFLGSGSDAATAVEYSQLALVLKTSTIPYLDCANANFTNTEGCILSRQYFATNYDGSPSAENDLEWPSAFAADDGSKLCPDFYRGLGELQIALSVLSAPNATIAPIGNFFFFNETSEFLLRLVPSPAVVLRSPRFFNVSGTSHLAILQQAANSYCRAAAKEYITATLNICNGVCHGLSGGTIDLAMRTVADYLFDPEGCYNEPQGAGNSTEGLISAVGTLTKFNTGAVTIVDGECALEVGPPVCGMMASNSTICNPSEETCFGDYCENGCTMATGMWKKNKENTLSWSRFCPQAWMSSVPNYSNTLETTPYYNAPSFTWAQIIDARNRGEACIIASKDLITAKLNSNCLSACVTPTVTSIIAELDQLLSENCFSLTTNSRGRYINGFGRTDTYARRRTLLLSDYLKSYNTGRYVGPGFCDLVDSLVLSELMNGIGTIETVTNSSGFQAVRVYGWMDWFIFITVLVLVGYVILYNFMLCMVSENRSATEHSKDSTAPGRVASGAQYLQRQRPVRPPQMPLPRPSHPNYSDA